MQDHSVPVTATGGNATVASGVVAWYTGTANQEHTILVTIPPGGDYAVVDMFM
jgi:phage-related minor tail protein